MKVARAAAALVAVLATRSAVAQPAGETEACIEAHATAQEQRNANQLVSAKEQLLVCAREACPALVRQACSDLLGQVMQQMPTVSVSIVRTTGESVVDATVTVDGAPWPALGAARDIDPGVHEVRVSHPMLGDAKRTITVVEGVKSQSVVIQLGEPPKRVDVAPTQPERSYVPPAGAFVFFGLSFAATGVAATLGGLSLPLADELEARAGEGPCRPNLCEGDENDVSDRDKLIAYRLGADVSFAIAGGLLGAGLIWWIADAAREPEPSAMGLAPWIVASPAGAGLGIAGAY